MTLNKERRHRRKKQLEINQKLRRTLYKDIVIYPCCYCHNVFLMLNLTIEHIIPLSFGGTNDVSNISLACAPCNQEKGRQSWFNRKDKNEK